MTLEVQFVLQYKDLFGPKVVLENDSPADWAKILLFVLMYHKYHPNTVVFHWPIRNKKTFEV